MEVVNSKSLKEWEEQVRKEPPEKNAEPQKPIVIKKEEPKSARQTEPIKPKAELPEPKDSINLIPLLTGFGVVFGVIGILVFVLRRKKGQDE